MGSMWPPGGPRGRAPKGKKGVNFKNLLLQTQKQYRLDFLHVDTCIYEEYNLFMARPKMSPWGPRGGESLRGGGQGGKYTFSSSSSEAVGGWISIKLGGDHP